MPVKSMNIMVNDYCNGRCTSCDIWKNKSPHRLSLEAVASACRNFPQVEDASLTGGEPFLRKNLAGIAQTVITDLRELKALFINTNGLLPERVDRVMKSLSGTDLYLCVSLEGDRETHNRLRGLNGFDKVMQTLRLEGNYHKIISTTLQPENCTLATLEFIQRVAEETGSGFTFRMADEAEYYHNRGKIPKIDRRRVKEVVGFMERFPDNPFFRVQSRFLATGQIPLMFDRGKVKCRAGTDFILVRSDETIAPCIYSARTIGDVWRGIEPFEGLGMYEECPCCTECAVYPMLSYGGGRDG